jgi:hypothetical protein
MIPAGGRYEWTVENGKKQPWYITRKVNEPIFMAGLTNFRPDVEQTVEIGFARKRSPRDCLENACRPIRNVHYKAYFAIWHCLRIDITTSYSL